MLPHLIRNSLDHGIEMPQERGFKGEVSSMVISFYENESSFGLSLSDDGRGVDPQAVAQRALKLNLASLQEIETMSDEEKIKFYFGTADLTPGLADGGANLRDDRRRLQQRGDGDLHLRWHGRGILFSYYQRHFQ